MIPAFRAFDTCFLISVFNIVYCVASNTRFNVLPDVTYLLLL